MQHVGQKYKNIIIAGLVAAVIGGGGIFAYGTHHKADAPKPAAVQQTPAKPAVTTYVQYDGEEGKTALDILKEKAKVETKQSSLGEYVVAVNGNDGGGKKYWLYYVNGQEANVGASAYATKAGDTIEWKLQ